MNNVVVIKCWMMHEGREGVLGNGMGWVNEHEGGARKKDMEG